jgi:hypothetical protein
VVKAVYNQFHNSYTNIYDIPDDSLIQVLYSCSYKGNTNWGAKAKCDAIRKDGAAYYQTLFMAGNKAVLSQDVYNKVFACVRALKDSPQTKNYFCEDNPFENIEHVYQQKFKGDLNGITYRGMADLLIVDHDHKVVYPCDLKTSHNREYNFPKSFIEFGYNIQARLYWRLIRQTMDRDEYFKDFKLEDFRFIVVNNDSNPTPVVWVFEGTQALGDIEVGPYKLRDPEKIGQELTYYLNHRPPVPVGISLNKPNSIEQWFKR